MVVFCLDSYNWSRAKASLNSLEFSGKYWLFHVTRAVFSLGDSLQGRAREWLQGVFPLVASPVGRPVCEGHTSATAGGEFVYLLCLYPEPIYGAGSGNKPVPFQHWSCQALGDEHMCRKRTVAATWLISLAPTQPSLGIPSHCCIAPVGNCPSVALNIAPSSLTFCLFH